jgi:hypothetical protein
MAASFNRPRASLQVHELLPCSRDGLGGYAGFGNLPRRGAPARHSTDPLLNKGLLSCGISRRPQRR